MLSSASHKVVDYAFICNPKLLNNHYKITINFFVSASDVICNFH